MGTDWGCFGENVLVAALYRLEPGAFGKASDAAGPGSLGCPATTEAYELVGATTALLRDDPDILMEVEGYRERGHLGCRITKAVGLQPQ